MGLFDFLRHPDQDDMTEIERAIAHNEARGDPVPPEWHRAANAGIGEFGSPEEQAMWEPPSYNPLESFLSEPESDDAPWWAQPPDYFK